MGGRSRVVIVAVAVSSALAGAGTSAWISRSSPVRIDLNISAKRLIPGQTFSVEVVPPQDLVCFDGAYRLTIRRGNTWVPTHDLAAVGDQREQPYVGPVNGERADEFSGCDSNRTEHILRLPSDALSGRYRLKKWFELDNEAARQLADAGYEVTPDCCLEVQWWVDFDVVQNSR